MLHETGIITKLVNGQAIVQTKSKLACSSCQNASNCGNGILEKYFSGKIFQTQIENRLNAKVGDEVVIEIPKNAITKASLIVYAVPLLSLLCFAIVGSILFEVENTIILLSMAGLIAGSLVSYLVNRQIGNRTEFEPKMVSVASRDKLSIKMSK